MNEFVASFRVPTAVKQRAEAELVANPMPGCKSANQLFRRIVVDHVKAICGFDQGAEVREAQAAGYALVYRIDREVGDFDEAYARMLRAA